jgi:hypothetical protein
MDMLYCPVEHADFEQPIKGKVRLGDLLFCSVLSNANIRGQISQLRNVSRSQGNVAWIVPSMIAHIRLLRARIAPLKSDRVAFQDSRGLDSTGTM